MFLFAQTGMSEILFVLLIAKVQLLERIITYKNTRDYIMRNTFYSSI